MNTIAARIPPRAMPQEVLRSPTLALLATGASVVAAGTAPELVSEPVIGDTSLLDAGAELVLVALVIRVEEESEPVIGLTTVLEDCCEPVTGLTTVLEVGVDAAPPSVELVGMAPVSAAVEEDVEVKGTTVVVLVLEVASEVLDGTIGEDCELSVLGPGEDVEYGSGDGLGRAVEARDVWAGLEASDGLGRVEAWETVASAADKTESALYEMVEDAAAREEDAASNTESAFHDCGMEEKDSGDESGAS